MRIGEALVSEGLLSPSQLEAGLRMQGSYGGRLASTLVELGYVDGDAATRVLARLRKLPAVLQKHFDSAERSVLAKVPKRVVEKYSAVPLGWASEGTLICAMVEPDDLLALEELRFLTGSKVVPGIALELRVRRALERWYGAAPKRDHGFVAMGGAEGLRELEIETTGHASPALQTASAPVTVEPYHAPGPAVDLTLDVPLRNPSTRPPPGLRQSGLGAARPELTLEPVTPPSPRVTSAPPAPISAPPPSRPSVTPRRAHPLPLRRDEPDEPPRASARPPSVAPRSSAPPAQGAYESAQTNIDGARSHDARLDQLVAWMRAGFEAGMLFDVRNDIAFSTRGFGPTVRGAPPKIAVPLTQPSLLVLPYEARTTFYGVPPEGGAELHERIWNALGSRPTREALALPILNEDGVVGLVYAHARRGQSVAPGVLLEAANLCAAIGRRM